MFKKLAFETATYPPFCTMSWNFLFFIFEGFPYWLSFLRLIGWTQFWSKIFVTIEVRGRGHHSMLFGYKSNMHFSFCQICTFFSCQKVDKSSPFLSNLHLFLSNPPTFFLRMGMVRSWLSADPQELEKQGILCCKKRRECTF